MKVLVDFHFSDFWADPAKQKAPKVWASMTVAEKASAISEYVINSLNTLKAQNVNVGMVQVGNETTGSFCGEKNWADMNFLFDAGCDAIHNFNSINGTTILAAVHFTNPESAGKYETIAANLADYDGNNDGEKEGVSYDVFASSYYPYWHGTMTNLTNVLSKVVWIIVLKTMVHGKLQEQVRPLQKMIPKRVKNRFIFTMTMHFPLH